MKVSLNELHVKCRNAFRGLGFPPGADEEAAYIISWLEVHGFEGLRQFEGVCACLKRNAFPASVEFANNNTIDCSQCCGIAVAPGVFDYLRSDNIESGTNELTLNHCSKAILFLPLILKHIDARYFWQVEGFEETNKTQIKIDAASERIVVTSLKQDYDRSNAQIRIKRVSMLPSSVNKNGEYFTFASLQQREQHVIENGLDVDDKQWRFVLDTAKKALVPATDESRKKGAGGGDSND